MTPRQLEALKLVIAEHAGKVLPEGTTVAVSTDIDSEYIGFRLLRYEGNIAVLESVAGEIRRVSASIVFDGAAVGRQFIRIEHIRNHIAQCRAATQN